jgi:hypothetical protein
MSASADGPQHPSILPGFRSLEHSLHDAQTKHSVPVDIKKPAIGFAVLVVFFFFIAPQQSILNFNLLIVTSPIWLTLMLARGTVERFIQAQRALFFAQQEYVLLELLIPREVTKTPLAMETFFSNMHIGSGETTWYKKFVQGSTRPSWSLEIVSDGGRIHFYIWTRKGYRRLVESFLYAQYPTVEIIEAEDYSRLVDPTAHDYGMFVGEYELGKSSAFPIKTYVDYKMEPGDKPEESVDPLAQLIETIGSIGPGEQFWVQIIIRSTKTEGFEGLVNKDGKPWNLQSMFAEAIEGIRAATVRKTTFVDPVTGAVQERENFPNPTRGQTDSIAAIERKASKPIFDVGIRTVYLAPETNFQGIMIPAQINLFKPFSTGQGNSLVLQSVWSGLFNDLPWEDPGGHHKHHAHHAAIQMYRMRAYFFYPYRGKWNNLSTEELATLFHIPTASVTTPGLQRIQSTTSNAPANLPQ